MPMAGSAWRGAEVVGRAVRCGWQVVHPVSVRDSMAFASARAFTRIRKQMRRWACGADHRALILAATQEQLWKRST